MNPSMQPANNSEAAIFEAALACATPQERAAYLDKACGADTALRARVEKLLAAHDQANSFMENPAARANPNATIRLELPGDEKPGDIIGHYKIREKIGEGGCGVVYVADQEQPVRRRVALKVVKLGMDTKQVVARFEAERQALALMDHPNIAKVLDAGSTSTGRPFFVMELVRGIKITDYCDQNNLSTEDRLKLFMSVCQAVQHAHQKGIIHRDIKPSNVLVTLHDGVPVPKVIDFGIAKATSDQRLTDKTIYTAFEQFLGTPAYMSPEQAEMSGLDIDTRSDIYSLGVLLYELLTGKTPFDPKTLLQTGIDQMRRIIREQEPPRPSTCLSTLAHADLTTVANHRRAEAPKLLNTIRGDLDWIVMKCLEKDRTRRYETANGLATEIQRHLSNEPIIARPPSVGYRVQKLVRRNKLAVATATGVFLILLFGIALSSWQAARASTAEQRADAQRIAAEREAVRSKQVAKCLKDTIEAAGPSVALGRDTTLLKEILDKTDARVGIALTNQPEVEAELRSIVGNTYRRIGKLEDAERAVRRSLEIRKSVYNMTNDLVAESLTDLARILANRGTRTIDAQTNPAIEGAALARQALALRTTNLGVNHPDTLLTEYVLASAIQREHKYAEAEILFRDVIEKRRRVLGSNHPDVASALNNLGSTLILLQNLHGSEDVIREAIGILKKCYGSDHPDVADCLQTLGRIQYRLNHFLDAESSYQEAMEIRQRLFVRNHAKIDEVRNYLIQTLNAQGKQKEIEVLKKSVEDPEIIVPELRLAIGNLLGRSGEPNGRESAQWWFSKAEEETSSLLNQKRVTDLELANVLADQVRNLLMLGKSAEGEPIARKCLAIHERTPTNNWMTFNAQSILGRCLLGQNRFSEAEPLLVSGCTGLENCVSNISLTGKVRLKEAFDGLASLYSRTGRTIQDAEKLHIRAINAIGDVFYEGGEGKVDNKEALKWYQKAADHDDAEGQYNLGWMYRYGTGVGRNIPTAIEWYRKSAAQGYLEAMIDLASIYNGNDGSDTNLTEAFAWYQKAAEKGDLPSARQIAWRLDEGIGVTTNKAEAFNWFKRIAEQSRNDHDLLLIAGRYEHGIGTEKDSDVTNNLIEAVEWYRRAADQENRSAQIRLARMYLKGQGVPKDAAQAAKLYDRAIHGDDPQSLNQVAWELATSNDPELRDGTNAILFAEKAVTKTSRKDPMILDTLAAAHAEAGQFTKAVEVQNEAMKLLQTEKEKTDYTTRLKLYESGKPYHETELQANE